MAGNALLRLRRDTAAAWTATNPILGNGEPGLETDTRKIKFGDGATAWTGLTYLSGAASAYSYATTAISYTETTTSGEKVVTVTVSARTVTLPTAVGNTAKLTFKLMVAGTLILDGNGAQTIDGGLTATLTTQYEAVTIVSDNANWLVI